MTKQSANWLEQLKNYGQMTSLDCHLALFFEQKSQLTDDLAKRRFLFLVAWLSMAVRHGHVCINLTQLTQKHIALQSNELIAAQIWHDLASPTQNHWLALCETLIQQQLIAQNSATAPFVLQGSRLYMQRMWQNEQRIIHFFSHNNLTEQAIPFVKNIVDRLFQTPIGNDININNNIHNNNEPDWQKIAVAQAITRKISIISGGPGTGKTTTAAKILAGFIMLHSHLQENQRTLRIIASAPTGKAAARLNESLGKAIQTLDLSADIKKSIPTEAITLHRLLGAKAGSNDYLHNKTNPLNVDILLIDEASMIDLSMMAKLIEALPNHAKLILLGDKEQLSSVEAGAVFGDLCLMHSQGYSQTHSALISSTTGFIINAQHSSSVIADTICLLQKSYRFNESSGIGLLANAIKAGDAKQAKHYLLAQQSLAQAYNDIAYYPLKNQQDYAQALHFAATQYHHYIDAIHADPQNIAHIWQQFNHFRLLCVLREGQFGVQGLNQAIETILHSQKRITLKKHDSWYIGRPIMILKNSFSLGIFNGDIGITLPSLEDANKLRVYFILADGSIKGYLPSRLPEHETAFAMTIHKSQGSEFNSVLTILPDEFLPLLTRSLLYTAITRAKKQAIIYADLAILEQTITNNYQRESGLIEQLLNADNKKAQ